MKLLSKILILLFALTLWIACQETETLRMAPPTAPPAQKPEPTPEPTVDPTPVPPTPTPTPTGLIWEFVEKSTETSDTLGLCSDNFELSTECFERGQRCHRNNYIYACLPEDKTLSLEGVVLDENDAPIEGAKVYGGTGYEENPDIGESFTDSKGLFKLKIGGCPRMLSAQKDGYSGPRGWFSTSTFRFPCIGKDFIGGKGIVFHLTKRMRSLPPSEPINDDQCHVKGKVISEKGLPLEGALFYFMGAPSVMTNEDGIYEVVLPKCPKVCATSLDNYVSFFDPANSHAYASCFTGYPADIILKKRNK